MNKIKHISRRQFVKATGISSGALILMGSIPARCVSAGVLDEVAGVSLNLFVSLKTDGEVEIIAHRSEMGTGIRTSLPQVVADEMNADWSRVKVIQGLANADYGSQNTDGSRSVRDFYTIMRQMGAAARTMLEQAAANRWSADVSTVAARDHAVYHPDGRFIGFGELATAAAKLDPPDTASLKLKSPHEFKYIGKSLPIVDLEDMVTGNTAYGIDVTVPGMVYASIERTPFLGGQIASYDAAAAKKATGVIDVVEIKGQPLPALFHPLEGVAVIATDTYSAMKGREQLAVKWKDNEHSAHHSESYLDELVARVATKPGQTVRERGDVDKALFKADVTVEATYRTPYLAHASMEPPMATAHIHDGICEIWASTQTPQATQKAVAAALAMNVKDVRVHVTLLGGGFGRKSKPDYSVEAALLAKKTGKPVQVTWTREDDIKHGYFHACCAQHYRAGLDSQGNVTGWLAREAMPPIVSTFVAGANMQPHGSLSQTFGSIPFKVPNLRLEGHPADPHVRIGWLRSVNNIPYGFGVGSFVDELANRAGRDTRDFLLDLIGEDRTLTFDQEGFEFNNYGRSLEEFPYDTARLKNVIIKLTETIPWGEQLPAGQGWGLAALRSFLTYVAVATKVEVQDDKLKVLEMHCAMDCGTVVNPDRVHAQNEGAMIFGLSLTLLGQIDFEKGTAQQSNFDGYPVARINQTPRIIKTHIMASNALPAGVGEPGVPPVAPSIANAIFAATGKRIRELPLKKHYRV